MLTDFQGFKLLDLTFSRKYCLFSGPNLFRPKILETLLNKLFITLSVPPIQFLFDSFLDSSLVIVEPYFLSPNRGFRKHFVRVSLTQFIDLFSKSCNADINGHSDPKCAYQDDQKYSCDKPLDAADYLGATFDVTDGYNSQGFRANIIKRWCRDKQKYKELDVPDGMQLREIYDTVVTTKSYSSVNEYITVCYHI